MCRSELCKTQFCNKGSHGCSQAYLLVCRTTPALWIDRRWQSGERELLRRLPPISKLVPWDVRCPALLDCVTHPCSDPKEARKYATGCGFSQDTEVAGGPRGLLTPYGLLSTAMYMGSCARPLHALRDQRPRRRSLAAERPGP